MIANKIIKPYKNTIRLSIYFILPGRNFGLSKILLRYLNNVKWYKENMFFSSSYTLWRSQNKQYSIAFECSSYEFFFFSFLIDLLTPKFDDLNFWFLSLVIELFYTGNSFLQRKVCWILLRNHFWILSPLLYQLSDEIPPFNFKDEKKNNFRIWNITWNWAEVKLPKFSKFNCSFRFIIYPSTQFSDFDLYLTSLAVFVQ